MAIQKHDRAPTPTSQPPYYGGAVLCRSEKGTQAELVAGMVSVGGASVKRAAAELVFEAVTGSVDGEDFAVVEQAVEDGVKICEVPA